MTPCARDYTLLPIFTPQQYKTKLGSQLCNLSQRFLCETDFSDRKTDSVAGHSIRLNLQGWGKPGTNPDLGADEAGPDG